LNYCKSPDQRLVVSTARIGPIGHHAAGRVHATLATHRVAESQVDAVTEVLTAEGLLGIVDGDPDALHGRAAIGLVNTVFGTHEQFVLGFARRAGADEELTARVLRDFRAPRGMPLVERNGEHILTFV
jgi:hypothetical protein